MNHTMRVVRRRPCHLEPGEMRRLSMDRRQMLLAFYLCCPKCGFVNVVFNNHKGQQITECDEGHRVSFVQPERCVFCNVRIHLKDSVAQLEEGPDVRHVSYKR